jgi:CRISPR-associated endonuclease/helicase Cas3
MEIDNILAKSNGITLLEHSNSVENTSTLLGQYLDIDMNDINNKKFYTLLHDIGKCTQNFQNILKDVNNESASTFRHNEIGWAFLYYHLNVDDIILNDIIYCVYWHHGISNRMNKYTSHDIYGTLTKDEILDMITISKRLLGNDLISDSRNENKTPIQSPSFYNKNNNNTDTNQNLNRFINRIFLISSDILASKFESNSLDINNLIKSQYIKSKQLNFDNNYDFDYDRFMSQKNIANDAMSKNVTLINAPAGYGKTNVGMIWSALNDRKLIWVCPQNIIAVNVYRSVLKTLEETHQHCNVLLVLHNDPIESNYVIDKNIIPDIIIINIDSYLRPTIDNTYATNLFQFSMANIIFDEFHLYVSNAPIFQLFLLMCKMRLKCNTKTLLLSATPNQIFDHIKTPKTEIKTQILPQTNQHYSAKHNKKYKIICLTNLNDANVLDDRIMFFNSIKMAQEVFKKYNYDDNVLMHGDFTDFDKNNIRENILNNYKTINCLVTTSILETSVDISFKNGYEIVCSPEATLQRLGRVNRFGEYECSTYYIIDDNHLNERVVVEKAYDKTLKQHWFKYLLNNCNNKELTLDELYQYYNKFKNEHRLGIQNYLTQKINQSDGNLSLLYPIKYNTSKLDSSVNRIGGNKLRYVGSDELYVTCLDNETNKYIQPITHKPYNLDWFLREEVYDERKREIIINEIKKIVKISSIFDYSDIKKDLDKCKNKDDVLKKLGKFTNTPHIMIDWEYDNKFGLMKKKNKKKV